MNKNSVLFVVFSAIALFGYFMFAQPQQKPAAQPQPAQPAAAAQNAKSQNATAASVSANKNTDGSKETFTRIETDNYKIVFTNKGAGVTSWQVKENSGQWVDLVLNKDIAVLTTFPDATYKYVASKSKQNAVFEYVSPDGWKVTKTYSISPNSYMNNIEIVLAKTKANAALPGIDFSWGPGFGTDEKELKENESQTRVIALNAQTGSVKKLEKESETAAQFKWAAIDNRYFLAAFIPQTPSDFNEIIAQRADKKAPIAIHLTATPANNANSQTYSVNFYAGPKGYTYLKGYNLGLEKSVDFGFFGFLGKKALAVLYFFQKITGNYGWAIVLLTCVIQVLVLPLTLKSFHSMAAMKRVQPMVKEIQAKFKDNPQRLQAEMMNVYKSQKVNPLGGCLPMLLQLPIFWAFFAMLRNAYELRNTPWILWVKDLSAPDQLFHMNLILTNNFNLLPLIMGAGMFLQQKLTSATADPAQRKMMYILPVVFTFMFWNFSSGLVLYWLTNSICSMIAQYLVIRKDSARVKHA
ncbi:membrane protein insertase YidC [Endomicrobium proavitum]|uniref:Membrane protein insertase YidC n=1 Tax=Endomicrobium proavitum TaxID=1408281 RepID=A0A0G3WIM7_9BACT|nr:membrane protein insertase YidC [Endomicrobium proavitum]AKL98491.1 Membrane protein insertase YidC [Endomicrobium proavitum]